MKKELKGFVCGIVTTAILGTGFVFAAGQWKTIDVLENDITVMVDGKQVTESNFVYNDRTYLPLRAVAEAVGKPVEYDEATNTAYIGTMPSENVSTPNIIYYSNANWCPDFGAYTGIPCNERKEKSYIYADVSANDFENYCNLLISLGFVEGTVPALNSDSGWYYFANGNCLVSILYTPGINWLAVLPAYGSWVPSEFVPNS